MVSDYSREILKNIFDEGMTENIKIFAKEISNSEADIYIVMARKAACFLRFLQRCGIVDISGTIVTDRVLDIDVAWIQNKKIAIIDDVIVSGTTIYRVIQNVKKANASEINVFVLGVTKSCNTSIFDYYDSNGAKKSYLKAPYVSMTEAGCIRTCSDIVSTFILDISPYDVDFPRHKIIQMSEYLFERIMTRHEWNSYDVSSSLQSKYGIYNITLIPTDPILREFGDMAGIPVSKMGFYKIRIFARKTCSKNKPILVNVVPYFLFNAISEEDTADLFKAYFDDTIKIDLQTTTKIRLLQYILAEKLFNVWVSFIERIFNKKINAEIDKDAFDWIFPRSLFYHVDAAIKRSITTDWNEVKEYKLTIKSIVSSIPVTEENKDNTAILQAKLIEPFSKLYHEEEKEARNIVQVNGVTAFSKEQYKKSLDRLNHGYSYQELIRLLKDFPDYYDKNTMVSLFLDEAIDTGIVVPIISKECIYHNGKNHFIYYRAYRHGEDVPFGEEQEKKCAILLKSYFEYGGADILSKLRVEKMLVLFLNIGISQNLFTYKPGEEILYKVRIGSYLHGNVPITDHPSTKRSVLYMIHKSDAVWLTEKLVSSGVLKVDTETNKYISVEDPIDLPIDAPVVGKISAIGDIFGRLYINKRNNKVPNISDDDLVLLSTCLYPKDIINALAAELAICFDRWKRLSQNPIEIDEIPDSYKRDNLYLSVNNGQKKYFSFIGKEGIQRIKEIEDQFNSSLETRIYANIWKQFWPENIEWDNKSIGESTRIIINRQGQYLIWYNILFRLLFASCTNSMEKSKEWLKQAESFCSDKFLYFNEFNNDKASKSIENQVKKMSLDLANGKLLNIYYQPVVKAINWLAYRRTIPLLQEIDLYIDKHGKPVEVEHFGHIVFCQVKARNIEKYSNLISSFTTEKSIKCRVVSHKKNGELQRGIWIFLRISEIKHIKKIINFIFDAHIPCERVYLFAGLSDPLKIRSSKIINTKYKYGQFIAFFTEVKAYIDSLHNEQMQLIVANEVNGCEKKDSLYKSFTSYKQIFVRKIDSELLFHDQISIRAFGKKEEGDINMLYDWYATQKPMSVFVSYAISEEIENSMIDSIVEYLKKRNITVMYYEDVPIGTDLTEFMRRIKKCDFTLIIGSKIYKEKAENVDFNDTGVSFEDRIISGVFSSVDRSKLIPVSFGNFQETIPVPYDRLKGVRLEDTSTQSLENLTQALLNAYRKQISKSS